MEQRDAAGQARSSSVLDISKAVVFEAFFPVRPRTGCGSKPTGHNITYAESCSSGWENAVKFRTFGDFPIMLDEFGNIPDDLGNF
jgi:hypothetical protein